jgi:hypothetical protein
LQRRRNPETGRAPGPGSDPHLRGCAAVGSCRIQASDGEIGHVDNLPIDDGCWHLRSIAVNTTTWLPEEKVPISCASMKEFAWPRRPIRLDIDRRKIEHSPKHDRSISRVRRKVSDKLRHRMGRDLSSLSVAPAEGIHRARDPLNREIPDGVRMGPRALRQYDNRHRRPVRQNRETPVRLARR